jgi:hypothetical protein
MNRQIHTDITALSKQLGNEIVFIGGIAIYLHTVYPEEPVLFQSEVTHDADALVSLSAYQVLRNDYDFVVNKRLHKGQVTIHNRLDVDIYVERQSRLRVDYHELDMYSVKLGHVKVACLSHLLLLKLAALEDRGGSAKGAKDRRDIAKLLALLGDLLDIDMPGEFTRADLKAIDGVIRSSAFMEIAGRNSKVASRLRGKAESFVESLR